MGPAYISGLAPSNDRREQMILDLLPQVRWIAASIHERLPSTVQQEDLVSIGIVGLIAAVDNFDESRNASLRTYAEHKIRGAILDSLRGLDSVSQHKRKRAKDLQSAIEIVERRLQRAPEEEEIAAELRISVEEYRQELFECQGITLGSLEVMSDDGGHVDLLRYQSDREEASPGHLLERKALRELLVAAIEALPKTERTIISLYYVEQLTLAEIGSVLELHFSRVSQLKSQAVLRLRTYIQKRWPGKAAL